MLTGGSSSSSYAAADASMCPPESSRTTAARRGGKTKAAEQKATKQPQRGLGVAQLEKIRLHNQMMAAYRSGGGMQPHHHQDASRIVPFAAHPGAAELMAGSSSPFHQSSYHTATAGHGIAGGVQYYGNMLQPTPPLFDHDVRDSAGRRLGQQVPPPPSSSQQHYQYWSGDYSSSTEELDLELRL